MECDLKVSITKTNQLKVIDTIRTLGAHECLQLQGYDQFKVTKEKMIESMANLNKTEIKPYLMHLYFNAH